MPQLLDTLAESVRELTGFDRVLVYRFDEDQHGEVVAEARADDLESYLGLHYPESDIPRQARELYLRNWIRSIPDARLLAGPAGAAPAARHRQAARPEPLGASQRVRRSTWSTWPTWA